MSDLQKTDLSVVMPIYRAADIVPQIVAQLKPVLSKIDHPWQIVFVDDGSGDGSWDAIQAAAASNRRIRGVKLSRNFGQQIAVSAGIAEADGQYLIVMDGDLQNPPEAISEILSRLKNGDDLVYTVSKIRNRQRDQWTSQLFWFVLSRLLKVDMVRDQLMMRGMSRRFSSLFSSYPEITRTVAGISRDIGMRYSVLEVANQRQPTGRTSYGFFNRFDLMVNMIISITTAPLSLLIYISLAVLLMTIAVSLYYLAVSTIYGTAAGFVSIMLAIFFFGSVTTLILGVIGMYLANIYSEVRRRPLFIIEEKTKHHG